MRLQITNASVAADETIYPLIRFAAKFFNVTGRVSVDFRETRRVTETWKADPRQTASGQGSCLPLIPAKNRQKLFSGYCRYSGQSISVCATLNPAHPNLPYTAKTLGYFPGSKIPISPYDYRTPEDIIVHVAAHEFAHLLKRGQKFRTSRIEVFCENRATEVLAAFRSDEGQTWIAAERARMRGGVAGPVTDISDDRETEKREAARVALAKCQARLKRWHSKAKRAATAIKKLNRQIARLEKKAGLPE